jgi:uncharacterized protein YqgV (UPF0045/DUF77 family)
LKFELSPSNKESFPHIYGQILTKDVSYYEPISSISRKVINAAIQIVPLQERAIAFPLIDQAIELISASGLPFQVGAFSTSVDGTYQQVIELVQQINIMLNTAASNEWICNVQIQMHQNMSVLSSDKLIKYQ